MGAGASRPPPGSIQQPCRFFAQNGYCQFGDRCIYQHTIGTNQGATQNVLQNNTQNTFGNQPPQPICYTSRKTSGIQESANVLGAMISDSDEEGENRAVIAPIPEKKRNLENVTMLLPKWFARELRKSKKGELANSLVIVPKDERAMWQSEIMEVAEENNEKSARSSIGDFEERLKEQRLDFIKMLNLSHAEKDERAGKRPRGGTKIESPGEKLSNIMATEVQKLEDAGQVPMIVEEEISESLAEETKYCERKLGFTRPRTEGVWRRLITEKIESLSAGKKAEFFQEVEDEAETIATMYAGKSAQMKKEALKTIGEAMKVKYEKMDYDEFLGLAAGVTILATY